VHLSSPDGIIWTQSDTQPEAGNAPTSSWLADQVIVDEHYLNVKMETPPGEYLLLTGLYDAQSGYRAVIFDELGNRLVEDQIPLGTISITD
jgi:hypothetical protein